MIRFVREFLQDRGGATAIEYGLLAALLGMVIATAITGLGTALWAKANTITDALN